MLVLLPLLLILLLPMGTARAHSPDQHSFKLVSFRRPFTAPPFALPSPSGEIIRLADFRGRVVLLNFWATWCPPCIKEMPSMERLYQKFRGQGLAMVAISTDTEGAKKVVPFVERLKLTFPIALDTDNEVSRVYGAGNLPSTFLINSEGKVVAAALGERDWFSAGAISYIEELLNDSRR